jgi:hypothetical protein
MAEIDKLEAKRLRLINKIVRSIAKHQSPNEEINNAFYELFDVSESQLFQSIPPTTDETKAKPLHARLALMWLLGSDQINASTKTVEILREYKEDNNAVSEMLTHLSDYLVSDWGISEKSKSIEVEKVDLILKHVLS